MRNKPTYINVVCNVCWHFYGRAGYSQQKCREVVLIQCGIDEAGRGPVIGPMVMSLVCADANALRNMGARDSKTLSRSRRELLYSRIKDVAEVVEIRIITVEELNTQMNSMTLNEIELNHAVELASFAKGEVVVDCFDVNEQRATDAMTEQSGRKITCMHKADRDFPAVSAASIISKVTRDREIDRIAEKYGSFGSGYPSDPATRAFLEKSFREGVNLEGVIRTHWSTVRELYKKYRTGVLF